MNLLYKVAAGDGVNLTVLVAYRMCFGAAVMFSNNRLIYYSTDGLHNKTDMDGTLERLEKLSLQTTTGKVKIIGIVIGIGGAMVFNLYRGKEINLWSTHVDLLHTHGEPHTASHKSPQGLLWGCMLSLGGCVSYALWFLVQVRFLYFFCFRFSRFFLLFMYLILSMQENQIKNFPYPYSSTALTSLMASIQSVIFALCVERDWKQWKLVLMASYSGILISGLALILMTWGVKKEGQFFASVFQPVLLVMVALAGSSLLDEKLHMGSLLPWRLGL
ncbi:hypothetical protein GBA52_024395 [Prunus armeniaca]|nr:hypothetical protein GBA52_024395 [Prunus armeniaca]